MSNESNSQISDPTDSKSNRSTRVKGAHNIVGDHNHNIDGDRNVAGDGNVVVGSIVINLLSASSMRELFIALIDELKKINWIAWCSLLVVMVVGFMALHQNASEDHSSFTSTRAPNSQSVPLPTVPLPNSNSQPHPLPIPTIAPAKQWVSIPKDWNVTITGKDDALGVYTNPRVRVSESNPQITINVTPPQTTPRIMPDKVKVQAILTLSNSPGIQKVSQELESQGEGWSGQLSIAPGQWTRAKCRLKVLIQPSGDALKGGSASAYSSTGWSITLNKS